MRDIFSIEKYGEVASTNDIAAEKAKLGAPEGTAVLALSQSAGRGRMGRQFVSEGGGLYLSVILRPTFTAEKSLLITTAAAVAVAETVEKYTGRAAKIKWVNDVYLDGKKVCGILTEGQLSAHGGLEYAVLGIGLNVCEPRGGFPKELCNIAGAMFAKGEYDTEEIARDILKGFFGYYKSLCEKPHFEGYAKRDMLSGKKVDILHCGETIGEAEVRGITPDFALEIEYADGKKENLATGEVSVKMKESPPTGATR